ncbi:MAG: hypothetical protein NTZ05_04420, partial [Chloroflexi bacterium]|nr:hypothetical protein [Chloroflexota bacterium]
TPSEQVIGTAGGEGLDSYLLYQNDNQRGGCTSISQDMPNLYGIEVGNDQVSSIGRDYSCTGWSFGQFELYEDGNYQGQAMVIETDVPDLRYAGFNDRASWYKTTFGWSIAMYSETDYRGTCSEMVGNVAQMNSLAVGNDSVSSIKLGATCPK